MRFETAVQRKKPVDSTHQVLVSIAEVLAVQILKPAIFSCPFGANILDYIHPRGPAQGRESGTVEGDSSECTS